MPNKKVAFKNHLHSKGLKFTPERSDILDAVLSMSGHFDVEQIHDKLRESKKAISVPTIYRSLPHLIDSGLIREVLRCKNRPQYEVDMGRSHHDHLLCLKCGDVFEFREDEIERLQEKVCKKFNFKAVEHRLGIRGYCKNCIKKINKAQKSKA